MKILDGRVDWCENYDNEARLRAFVDHIPKLDELRYERRGNLYYAELDGYVHFLYYERPGDGFGGAVFTMHMKDGSVVVAKGPWSSGTYVMNRAGFGPCVECSLTDDPSVWERGYTFYGGAITLELAQEVAKFGGSFLVYGGEDKPRGITDRGDLSGEQRGIVGWDGIHKLPTWTWVPDPTEKQRRRRVAKWREMRRFKGSYGWDYMYLVLKPIWSLKAGEAYPSNVIETISRPKDLEGLVRDGVFMVANKDWMPRNFPQFTLIETWPEEEALLDNYGLLT